MYAWILRHLPGPKWPKVLESAVLIALIVRVLFIHVYPRVQLFFGLGGAGL